MISHWFVWAQLYHIIDEYHRFVCQHQVNQIEFYSHFQIENTIFQIISGTSYERQVSTIASWIEGLSSDNYAHTSCQPRKIELPVMRTEACTGFLIESQGCVGVVGARSTLCKVISYIFICFKWILHTFIDWNRMMLVQVYCTAHPAVTMNSLEFYRIDKVVVLPINHRLSTITIYRCTQKSIVTWIGFYSIRKMLVIAIKFENVKISKFRFTHCRHQFAIIFFAIIYDTIIAHSIQHWNYTCVKFIFDISFVFDTTKSQ